MASDRSFDKSLVVWLLLIALLLLLVVNPLARLLWASFEHPDTGAFTLDNYAAAYGRWRYIEALINSLVIGLAVAVVCTVFGVPMAWAVSRTDMPGKGLVWAAMLGTFIMPNYLGAVAWILMAGPNAGWLNRIYTGAHRRVRRPLQRLQHDRAGPGRSPATPSRTCSCSPAPPST